MKVEIIGLNDMVAKCRVSDNEGRCCDFAVGSIQPAHQLLTLMIKNAATRMAQERIEEEMRTFAGELR